MGKLIDRIVDWWLTWRTGQDCKTREWNAWYYSTVNVAGDTVDEIFANFKHVFIVDPWKFFDPKEPFGWVPVEDVQQYLWPQRPFGENTVAKFERVEWDEAKEQWRVNGFGGEDKVFVATNNSDDAMMIMLKYV